VGSRDRIMGSELSVGGPRCTAVSVVVTERHSSSLPKTRSDPSSVLIVKRARSQVVTYLTGLFVHS
jgi:hypothetical protein